MLWADRPPIERFSAAAAAGFDTVEMLFPNTLDRADLQNALSENQLEMALFDVHAGNWESGDRGVAAFPDRVEECRELWRGDLDLASELGTSNLTVLAGIRPPDQSAGAFDEVLVDNLIFLSDLATGSEVFLTVEAINNQDVPGFHIRTIEHAVTIVDAVGRQNVAVQFDQYHVSREHQDPVGLIEQYFDKVRHVQIADSPGRHEPGTGDARVGQFLHRLEELGYQGRVGLEYSPSGDTDASLHWLPRSARSG